MQGRGLFICGSYEMHLHACPVVCMAVTFANSVACKLLHALLKAHSNYDVTGMTEIGVLPSVQTDCQMSLAMAIAGLPHPTVTWWIPVHDVGPMMTLAVIVMLVDLLESTSIARALARKNGYELRYNQEIVGLGLANFVGAAFNSYTTTGSFSRSSVNNASGERLWGLATEGVCLCGWYCCLAWKLLMHGLGQSDDVLLHSQFSIGHSGASCIAWKARSTSAWPLQSMCWCIWQPAWGHPAPFPEMHGAYLMSIFTCTGGCVQGTNAVLGAKGACLH